MANIQKRTNNKGDISYRVQIRLKGYPPQTATFERLTDARTWAKHTETEIQQGRHFKTAESKKHSLSQAIERYFKDILAHRQNPINQKTYLNWWVKQLGVYTLADITSAIIIEKRNELVGSVNKYGRAVGTTTANRYVQALGHVFTIANKEWGWVSENPVSNISKYKESRGRVRFLSDEERESLLEACKLSENPHLFKVVVLALSTGARKMEILGLEWKDIDFGRGMIVLHETKNGERRVIPLQGYAREIIEQSAKVRNLRCGFVFPSVTKCQPIDIRTAWETALKSAGIQDFRFHDLRHSAASYLAMNGASLAEIAEVLGHKTLQMVKRYAHLSEAHTSSVVEKMNKKIFG